MAQEREGGPPGLDSDQGLYFSRVWDSRALTGLLQWNFEKFLVDQNGNVVNRWASTTAPEAIDAAVEKLLETPKL